MSPLLEAAMLGAFSISWYCSIWKMLRTRQASGKSLGFVLLICFGYVCGIASKLALYRDTGVWSELILLYVWNLLVTGFDAWLVVQFTREAPVHRWFSQPERRRATGHSLSRPVAAPNTRSETTKIVPYSPVIQ
jgi:hypothetical protein